MDEDIDSGEDVYVEEDAAVNPKTQSIPKNEPYIQSEDIREIRELIQTAPAQPHAAAKSYSVKEDLTIYVAVQTVIDRGLKPDIRKIAVSLSSAMARSSESIRERYKRYIKDYSEDKIRELVEALKNGEQFPSTKKSARQEGANQKNSTSNRSRLQKSIKPKNFKKIEMQLPKQQVDLINCLVDYEPSKHQTALRRQCSNFQGQSSYVYSQIKREEDQKKQQMEILTKKLNISQEQTVELLHKCSLDQNIAEQVLEDPERRKELLWEEDEDNLLINAVKDLRGDLMDTIKKFKGEKNTEVRIQYLSFLKKI